MRLGKLDPQIPGRLGDLLYYSSGPLPSPPGKLIVLGVNPWGMLGNDTYGDCGVAGIQHLFMAAAFITHELNLTWPTDQQCIDYYLKYNNGQDVGVVLSAFLAYVNKNGYYNNHDPLFTHFDPNNVPFVQTATFLYGATYAGIQVPQSAMDQVSAGQPWTVVQGSPIEGGHCIPIVGYDDQWLYCVTWGRVQPMSYNFWHTYADEAWAVLSGELVARHGDGRGVNINALRADIALL